MNQQDNRIVEDFLIENYKHLDTMKSQIKARFEELEGHEPLPAALQLLCWDIWRLTTFHVAAFNHVHGEENLPADRAPYMPSEFSGEHFERLREMDMRLQAVLGDTLDEDDGEENDSDDSSLFDFEPSPEEQITMAEYGSIIVEHRWFVEEFNKVQLGAGEEDYAGNWIQLHHNGFEEVMRALWKTLRAHMGSVQS
jgi:hypothetical protein